MINESPQDKMIRELKVENQKLREILRKLAAAGGDTVNLAELGLTNMQELVEDMDENDKIMDDLQKPWEEKLAEEKAKSKPIEAPIDEQDTMEESKEMSRIDTTGEVNTSSEIFGQPAFGSGRTTPVVDETKEPEEVVPLTPAQALALRKAKKSSVNLERNVPHITNLNEDP